MKGEKNIENNAKNNNITNHDFYKGKPITKCRLSIWFGTLWLLTDKPREILEGIFKALDAKYVHGQYEQGGNSKDNKYEGKHLQFTVHLKKNQYLSWIKARVKLNVDWTASRSIAAENYVSKEDTRIDGPWEFGVKPKEVVANAEKIKDKKITINQAKDMTMPELMDHYGFLNFPKVVNAFRMLNTKFTKENMYKPKVVFYIWGEEGLGKSFMAEYMMFTFVKTIQTISFIKNGLFNGGYWTVDPEWSEEKYKTAYYDEWRDDVMPHTEFLKLIDYKVKPINVKNSHALNDFQIIFITTVQSPEEIYSDVGEFKYRPTFRNQIYKRLDCIIHLKEDWKLRYKKYINAGVFDIGERIKKAEEVNPYDDKIVNREERINNEFDIDKFDFDEFLRKKNGEVNESNIEEKENNQEPEKEIDFEDLYKEEFSCLRTPEMFQNSELEGKEESKSLIKYFISSRLASKRESFIENMINGDYNQIVFNGGFYWGDDWSAEIAVLKLDDKIPFEDFQRFIKEDTLNFKTRKGIKTPKLKYIYFSSFDLLINLYPEFEEKNCWFNYLKIIDINSSTERKYKSWSDAFIFAFNKIRKNIFDFLFK